MAIRLYSSPIKLRPLIVIFLSPFFLIFATLILQLLQALGHDSACRSTVCLHKSTGINWRLTSPMLRAAEFHGTLDIDAVGTSFGQFVKILVDSTSSKANRPWWSRLVLNILELPHDASTSFNGIVMVPLMFSIPPCAMEAHVDPRSKIICVAIKRKVLLCELLPSNMDLLFVIEVATVREMHDNICENVMMSDDPEESNRVPVVISVHIFSMFTCVWHEKRLVQFFSTFLSNAILDSDNCIFFLPH
ncbi:LOW QUALITY PROTEIN: hypothetical protein Cgig2_013278 [Carnegiea gigantea]|uniref:Uncharacterized protein n=1 Tax=Carnegiea gigantea TaxID=171969 RepID=A0A9Q1QC27_9CARY|nr:LOW QUALITY PROTEIN: hypothetical protein Cgig2_013278 [Carnegiea gigantea]